MALGHARLYGSDHQKCFTRYTKLLVAWILDVRLVLVMDDSRGDSHVVEAETEKKVLAIYKGRKRTVFY